MHYAYDTVALAKGTGNAVVKAGGKSWYFLTADYAFGHSLESDTTDGGQGQRRHGGRRGARIRCRPRDFSSFLLQAQSSKAQILGLANAGGDTINSIKAANEFGITKTMKLAGLLVFINDVHSLGLKTTAGHVPDRQLVLEPGRRDARLELASASSTRSSACRRSLQAADYSAAMTLPEGGQGGRHRRRRQGDGADEEDQDQRHLRQGRQIRADGRMVHDMYLMQVKTPSESKEPWDYYKLVAKVPGRAGVHDEGRVASARC